MKKSSFTMIFLFAIIFVLQAGFASSHLDTGLDEAVDGYIIDFGYAPEHPEPGKGTILNFNLVNESTDESVEFTHLWIRISRNNIIVFSGTLRPTNDNVNFIYTFDDSGEYKINLRFYNDENVIVDKSYPLNVLERNDVQNPILAYITLTLVLLAVIVSCIKRFLSSSKNMWN